MIIRGTRYSIQLTNYKEALGNIDVIDLLHEAQLDIMVELAAAQRDLSIGMNRAWTSDTVHFSITSVNKIVHTICGLYLAAMIQLWGNVYGFFGADLEFLETKTDITEVIGRGLISGVIRTVES